MTSASIDHQARALVESVGVRRRDDLRVLRLQGEDQRGWLNGQVTNDVRHTQPGDGVYCLAVTVRGKIMADLWALDGRTRAQDEDALIVLLPGEAADRLLESFESQIIMEDVELTLDDGCAVISVQGPLSPQLVPEGAGFACDELGSGGRFILAARDSAEARLSELSARAFELGGMPVDEAGFELARLRAGRARFGRDFGDQNYPQEAGLKRRAVSFNKGCYLGQEVVCTLENRGRLSKRLARLDVVEGAVEVGQTLSDAQGKPLGTLTSRVADPSLGRDRALGYLKAAAAVQGSELRAGEARLVVTGLVEE